MKKIKLILFRILNYFSVILVKTNIHRKIPWLVSIYNVLFKKFWPYKNIIEIQGSKMYVNINYESLSMCKTFQSYAMNKMKL